MLQGSVGKFLEKYILGRHFSPFIGKMVGAPWDRGSRPAVKKNPCWSPLKGDMGPNKYPRDIRCIWG